MKSKTKIKKQTIKKKNSELIEIISLAQKNPKWIGIAGILSGPTRNRIEINLDKIEKEAKAGETIIVPGKILSLGEISKKVKVVALNFSEKAKEKLLKAGCEVIMLKDEIQKNKDAKGVKILK